MRRILPEGSRSEWRDASGTIQLCEMHIDSSWFGNPVSRIENITSARVAFLTRLGEGIIPDEHTVLQDGRSRSCNGARERKIAVVEAALAKSSRGCFMRVVHCSAGNVGRVNCPRTQSITDTKCY